MPPERCCTWPRACSTTTCPPKRLGMTTVWIDRRDGRPGGATPEAHATPDARFASMQAFAADAVPAE